MATSIQRTSIYHGFQASFVRDRDGNLIHAAGPRKSELWAQWQTIKSHIDNFKEPLKALVVNRACFEDSRPTIPCQSFIYETHRSSEAVIVGMLFTSGAEAKDTSFQAFFSSLLLRQVHISGVPSTSLPSEIDHQRQYADAITYLFDKNVRFIAPNDMWKQGGGRYFIERVEHYTQRNVKVEFCLPAFPCKSSNPEKVMGTMPDKGEEMALMRLHNFVKAIEEVYPPGARIWIISDGHVFSDCIGVDDGVVDQYTATLIEMNNTFNSSTEEHRVEFRSLTNLFGTNSWARSFSRLAPTLNIPQIDHFLDVQLSDEAELCRRLLMFGCESDRSFLRQKIDSQQSSTLALYRGFSRFMLEDLALHPMTTSMTRSQQKKLASKVSFEMMMRNQAYSNFVELLFPDHVRLSIHAHNNSGPKFGIQLFDPMICKPSSQLPMLSDDSNQASGDVLHIPTPWHNCVTQVTGSPTLYVGKSRLIKMAMQNGHVTGQWVTTDRDTGGYFEVRGSSHSNGLDLDREDVHTEMA